MVENSSSIKDRILKIPASKGLSKEKFFEILGVSYGNFKGKSKTSSLSSDVIVEISSIFPDVNIEWLLSGKGPMLKEETRQNTDLSAGNKVVPLIPLHAMAGQGIGSTTVMDYDISTGYVVPDFKGVDFMIKVKGSSMQPKYNSGDVVACKKLNLADIFFQWNKVYVLDTEQGALIKRVRKGSDDNHILIVSDNDKYEPFQLHLSKIHAIAIVMGVIRLE